MVIMFTVNSMQNGVPYIVCQTETEVSNQEEFDKRFREGDSLKDINPKDDSKFVSTDLVHPKTKSNLKLLKQWHNEIVDKIYSEALNGVV